MMKNRMKGIMLLESVMALCILLIMLLTVFPILRQSSKLSVINARLYSDLIEIDNFCEEFKSNMMLKSPKSSIVKIAEEYNERLNVYKLNIKEEGENLIFGYFGDQNSGSEVYVNVEAEKK